MRNINPYRYKNKYRIASARRPGWDYADTGYYFITICTSGDEFFGNVVNDKDGEARVGLSAVGEIADGLWREIPRHFDCVILDKYVVMPNHVHGIVIINDGHKNAHSIDAQCRDAINRVSTVDAINGNCLKNKQKGGVTGKYNPMGKKSLSEIIRWYKGRCKFEINKTINDFSWQARYHDRIIRDAEELNRTREYIADNPKNWPLDKNNKSHKNNKNLTLDDILV